ncbi:FAD-dependent oxidoreductase [Anaerosinus massiliensis]|uniref:FAD-dependent oxidoreductase n=1 Tax=Massilibacillus massiliensis TaxID=1806837 RepID=UPI000A8972E1|nr:FAD-dependent oxidoreductase [Massilibacillus massiliensis]
MFKINTLEGHNRMSTQDLLMTISEALANGETEFDIMASGQHDIGGPLWHPEGKKLTFRVTNAGQRVGSMCLENTEIIVDGSASADVGWLNAGGKIVVKGDAGDTAGHCAAAGKIYIGGRAGTRSGSLMKHDPLYDAPEMWILKNVGSFSFEFMGGGKAVVCGYDSEAFESVLGDRACVGMVGGVLYFRGKAAGFSTTELKITALEAEDIAYLAGNMDDFLQSIDKPELYDALTNWSDWHKLRPLTFEERVPNAASNIKDFRTKEWIEGGIFSDVCMDDFVVNSTVMTGLYRQRVPAWENAKYAAPCEFNCPASIPTQRRYNLLREGKFKEAYELVLDYTPFPGSVCGSVCPNLCMEDCTRGTIDESAQIGKLGLYSVDTTVEMPSFKTGKKVAVLGGGVAGLNAAWQLARRGHDVTVYEEDAKMGGKLEQVIPRSRLPQEILQKELKRIEDIGVQFINNYKVTAEKFVQIKASYDAVIVATGGHNPTVFPWPGKEKIVKGLHFLKAINKGQNPKVGKHVIVIGCGNSGMDAALGAYQMGAETVTCIDVQKPAAFAKEIAHVKALGGKLVWPVMTKEVTDDGLITSDGQLIPGDMVIITVGETPELEYLPEGIEKFRAWLVAKADKSIMQGVFAAGDVIKPGRLVDAIGAGTKAAHAVDLYVRNLPYESMAEKTMIPSKQISKAYFSKCHSCDLPAANKDHNRCISCGTCRDCQMCLKSCPEKAITRVYSEEGTFEYESNSEKCIGCGICAGVCPCGIWTMSANSEKINMYRTYNKN